MAIPIENEQVPDCCLMKKCNKNGCGLIMDGLTEFVLVDMDCKDLGLPNKKRCDFLFLGKENTKIWVVPIELKSGTVKDVKYVRKQLQGGTDLADNILSWKLQFEFNPVLAHGRPIHRDQLKKLRSTFIYLRGEKRKVTTIACNSPLIKALSCK